MKLSTSMNLGVRAGLTRQPNHVTPELIRGLFLGRAVGYRAKVLGWVVGIPAFAGMTVASAGQRYGA